jgi:hypothetical protein
MIVQVVLYFCLQTASAAFRAADSEFPLAEIVCGGVPPRATHIYGGGAAIASAPRQAASEAPINQAFVILTAPLREGVRGSE